MQRNRAVSNTQIIAAVILIAIIIAGILLFMRGEDIGAEEQVEQPQAPEQEAPAQEQQEEAPAQQEERPAEEREAPPKAKIIFASTQLAPVEEQAFVKNNLLPPFTEETGITVEFVPMSYEELATRLEADIRAGRASVVDVIGDLHGGLDFYASKGWLMDLSTFGSLPDRTFPQILEEYSNLYGIKAYIPWMTATYVFVVDKEAFNYLPPGLTQEDVVMGTEKWTYQALLEWARSIEEATGKKALGFPAGPKGLFHRFLHGYLYPSFTGAQVTKFYSDEAVEMWNYLAELWKYVNPASTTWDAMADPLLRGGRANSLGPHSQDKGGDNDGA